MRHRDWGVRLGKPTVQKPPRYSESLLCPYSPHPKQAPHPMDPGCAFELSPCFLSSFEFVGSHLGSTPGSPRELSKMQTGSFLSRTENFSPLPRGKIIRSIGFYQIHHPAPSQKKLASFLVFAWAII